MIGVPDTVIPLNTHIRQNLHPVFSKKEKEILEHLSKCGVAFRSTAEKFWRHPVKGKRKVQSLLNWGILYSYSLANEEDDIEVVTLSPAGEDIIGSRTETPYDAYSMYKRALASEIYLRLVLAGVNCEHEDPFHPLAGIFKANGIEVGVLVLFRYEKPYFVRNLRHIVVCEGDQHIKQISEEINISVLYTTYDLLQDNPIHKAFVDENLNKVTVEIFKPCE